MDSDIQHSDGDPRATKLISSLDSNVVGSLLNATNKGSTLLPELEEARNENFSVVQ